MFNALRTREGPRYYQEIREWLGTSRFDTDAVDLAAVNTNLARLHPAATDTK